MTLNFPSDYNFNFDVKSFRFRYGLLGTNNGSLMIVDLNHIETYTTVLLHSEHLMKSNEDLTTLVKWSYDGKWCLTAGYDTNFFINTFLKNNEEIEDRKEIKMIKIVSFTYEICQLNSHEIIELDSIFIVHRYFWKQNFICIQIKIFFFQKPSRKA